MKRISAFALLLATLTFTGCTDDHPGTPAASTVPEAKVTGPGLSCLPLSQIRESRIRDDSTIDFIGTGGNVWRVSLPQACPSLKSENRFTYETSLSQLCSSDIIYVLQNYGGQLHRGAGCGLSQFVPVKLVK